MPRKMSIGTILKKIEQNGFKDDQRIEILTVQELSDKKNGKEEELPTRFLNGYFGSYRGYYKDMHLGYDVDFNYDSNKKNNLSKSNVGRLRSTLLEALKQGIMSGYKGGEFPIKMKTIVWAALDYGNCSRMYVCGIEKFNDSIFIVVNVEYYE